jgi:hypothetical protein
VPMPPSEEPLRKVTLNLFEKDIHDLKRVDEYGWTSLVRMIVREYLIKRSLRYRTEGSD